MFAREYELIWIVRPDVAEDDLAAIAERTSAVVTTAGGAILEVDEWGQRKLAYDIQKFSKGHFVRLHFVAQADVIAEMERTLRIDDRILRFLTVKLEDRVEQETRIVEMAAKLAEKASQIPAPAVDATV